VGESREKFVPDQPVSTSFLRTTVSQRAENLFRRAFSAIDATVDGDDGSIESTPIRS